MHNLRNFIWQDHHVGKECKFQPIRMPIRTARIVPLCTNAKPARPRAIPALALPSARHARRRCVALTPLLPCLRRISGCGFGSYCNSSIEQCVFCEAGKLSPAYGLANSGRCDNTSSGTANKCLLTAKLATALLVLLRNIYLGPDMQALEPTNVRKYRKPVLLIHT